MLSNYLDKYVITQAVIAVVILLSTPFLRYPVFGLQLIGIILLIIGIVIAIVSVKNLGSALTPVVTPKKDARLVTSGLYSIVRHPIYTGVILIAIGWSLSWCSLLAFLFSLVLFVFFNFKIRAEEKLLSQQFIEYNSYKAHVKKKLIPFIY